MGRNRKNKKAKQPKSKETFVAVEETGSRLVSIAAVPINGPNCGRRSYVVKGVVDGKIQENDLVEVPNLDGPKTDSDTELVVPENAKFRSLYQDPNLGLGTESSHLQFKLAASKAYLKYGAIITTTCRQLIYSSNNMKEADFHWDTLNLPPKPYAVKMIKLRKLFIETKPDSEPEVNCGMDAKDRATWTICSKPGVCDACMRSCLLEFSKAGIGMLYKFKEFEIKPTKRGELEVTGALYEKVIRLNDDAEEIKHREGSMLTAKFRVKDRRGSNILKPKVAACLKKIIVLASDLTGDGDEEFDFMDIKLGEGGGEQDSSGPEEDDSDSEDSVEAEGGCDGICGEECPMCRIFGCGALLGKLKGIKDWNPLTCSATERQFILRSAKKYHIDIEQSKILQLTISSLKLNKVGDDGVTHGPEVPKFARTKTSKRKVFGRKDFPKFEFTEEDFHKLSRPYFHLDLLQESKEDAIFILALADTIGLGKIKPEMISVYEKHFGCDVRLEQFRSEVKQSHKFKSTKKVVPEGEGSCGANRVPDLPAQD